MASVLHELYEQKSLGKFRALLSSGSGKAAGGGSKSGGGHGNANGGRDASSAAGGVAGAYSQGGSSLSRSPRFPGLAQDLGSATATKEEVNARDGYGRTVLHLVVTDGGQPIERRQESTSASKRRLLAASTGAGTAAEGAAPYASTIKDLLSASSGAVTGNADEKDAQRALEYLEPLLQCPTVNVNLQDRENGYTALHRAAYAGNLVAARRLLQHPDVETGIRDLEGLTAFDLLNSTLLGTNPADALEGTPADDAPRRELVTWGANRNFVLGLQGDSDRTFPERVPLERSAAPTARSVSEEAFAPLRVTKIVMEKLHSGLMTDEPRANFRVCGAGSSTGRLGHASNHPQFSFEPLKGFEQQCVTDFALGQDHTILCTDRGDVWTFGLNAFSVLGHPPEAPTPTKQGGSAAEEPVQVLPKRLVGVLKKEFVLGVAASRYHSCAYTSDSLYTWGKNNGQLGYPALATPLQHTPRKVTALAQPIQQMCATEVATVCLLEGGEVFVLHRDTHYKIAAFPMSRFPPSMQVYRPPGISARPTIFKVAGSGGTFIALSTRGDVFSWTLDNPALEGASASFAAPGAGTGRDVKPVRIWEDRKTFTAVADAAIAGETIVLATRSGHVFVRSRKKELATVRGFELKGGASGAQSNSGAGVSGNARKGLFKFVKVANLQRVVSVAVSPSGGFGAIRADAPLLDIAEQGDALPDSLLTLLPHYRRLQDEHDKEALVQDSLPRPSLVGDALRDETGEEEDDEAIGDDRIALDRICRCLQRWDATWSNATSAAGSDILVVANPSGVKIPAHSAVLAARSPVLAAALQSDNPHTSGVQVSRNGTSTLSLPKCSHLSVLLLLHYLYTDTLPAIYDARLFTKIRTVYPDIDFSPIDIKAELQSLANLCELPALGSALRAYGKALPQATLASNLLRFKGDSEAADVVLETEQEDFRCHSVVLRARSPFFASMLDDPDWYAPRTLSDSGDGKTRRASLHVDMQHISADIIRLVLRYIYTDPTAAELFEEKIFERPDEKLDYLMSVMAAANELLLDRLKAVCSGVIRPLVNMQTVCSVLCEAIFYEEASLQVCCTQYICCNMETMLEQRLLDILPLYALDRLAAFCQEKQLDRLPRTARMGARLAELRVTHAAWLKDRDFARNTGGFRRFVRRQTVVGVGAKSPRLSPAMFSTSLRLSPSGVLSPPRASEPVRSGSRQPPSPTITASPGPSPLIEAVIPEDDEGMFDMDDLKLDEGDAATPRRVASPAVTSTNKAPWQRPVLPSAATAPRSLRDIMAGDAGRSDSSRTTASHPFPALGMASSTPPSASGPGIASKASASAESPVSAPVLRLSQRDRKRQQQVTAEQQQLAAAEAEAKRSAGPTASSSPWRPSAPPAAWKPPDSPALASPGIGASGLAARPSFSSIQSAQASSPSIGSGFPVSQSAASSPAFRRTSSTAISRTPSGSGAGATPASNSGTPVRPSPQHQLSQGGTPPVNPASAIGAPVITPTRLQPPKRTVSNLHPYSQGPPERRSSDVPWVNYTSTVAVLPDASNAQLGSSSGAIWEDAAQEQQSFATIQSLQATEREALRSKKGPRSLAEIQAEENAQREEAAFLVWFEEESRKAQTELGRGNAPAHSQARQKREPSDGAGRSGRGRGRGGGSERGGRGGGGGRGKGAHTGASASEGHSAAPEQPRHGLARGEHRGDGQSGRGRGRGSKRGGKGQEASNNNNGPPTPAAGGLSANAKPFEMGTL